MAGSEEAGTAKRRGAWRRLGRPEAPETKGAWQSPPRLIATHQPAQAGRGGRSCSYYGRPRGGWRAQPSPQTYPRAGLANSTRVRGTAHGAPKPAPAWGRSSKLCKRNRGGACRGAGRANNLSHTAAAAHPTHIPPPPVRPPKAPAAFTCQDGFARVGQFRFAGGSGGGQAARSGERAHERRRGRHRCKQEPRQERGAAAAAAAARSGAGGEALRAMPAPSPARASSDQRPLRRGNGDPAAGPACCGAPSLAALK